MEMKCKKCGYKYVSAPDRYCVNCGYHFDYIEREETLDIQTMKQMPNLLYIRTGMCAICEKGETRKGLHAYASITNKGVLMGCFKNSSMASLRIRSGGLKKTPAFCYRMTNWKSFVAIIMENRYVTIAIRHLKQVN